MTDSTIPSNLGNRVIPLSIVIDQLRDKVSPDVLNTFLDMLNKQVPEVRPGDLITAEFMNAILSDIRALEHRVLLLEKGTSPIVPVPKLDIQLSSIKPYDEDTIKPFLTELGTTKVDMTAIEKKYGAIRADETTAFIGMIDNKGGIGILEFTVTCIDKDLNNLPIKLEAGNYTIKTKIIPLIRQQEEFSLGDAWKLLPKNGIIKSSLSTNTDFLNFTLVLSCTENTPAAKLEITLEKDNQNIATKQFDIIKQPALDLYKPYIQVAIDSSKYIRVALNIDGLLVAVNNNTWIRPPIVNQQQDFLCALVDQDSGLGLLTDNFRTAFKTNIRNQLNLSVFHGT